MNVPALHIDRTPSTGNIPEQNAPNFIRRRLIAGITAAAIALPGAAILGDAVSSHVKQVGLENMLNKDGADASDKFFHGDYQGKDVIGADIRDYRTPSEAAAKLAQDGDRLKVQDAIEHQAGDNMTKSDGFVVLPNSEVDPDAPGLTGPVQDDLKIHVG